MILTGRLAEAVVLPVTVVGIETAVVGLTVVVVAGFTVLATGLAVVVVAGV